MTTITIVDHRDDNHNRRHLERADRQAVGQLDSIEYNKTRYAEYMREAYNTKERWDTAVSKEWYRDTAKFWYNGMMELVLNPNSIYSNRCMRKV